MPLTFEFVIPFPLIRLKILSGSLVDKLKFSVHKSAHFLAMIGQSCYFTVLLVFLNLLSD